MRKLLLLIECLMAMQYGWAQDQSPEQKMLVSNASKLREWRTTGNFDPKPYVEKPKLLVAVMRKAILNCMLSFRWHGIIYWKPTRIKR